MEEPDNRSKDEHQADCTALACKISEVLHGARLIDVASVTAGLAGFALAKRYRDLDQRAAAFIRIVNSMAHSAGFTDDVMDKWVHNEDEDDADTIH